MSSVRGPNTGEEQSGGGQILRGLHGISEVQGHEANGHGAGTRSEHQSGGVHRALWTTADRLEQPEHRDSPAVLHGQRSDHGGFRQEQQQLGSQRCLKEGTKANVLHQINEAITANEFEQEVMNMNASMKKFPRRPHHPKYADVMEMWAGTCPMTKAAIRKGLIALEPGDLNAGWDYWNRGDREFAKVAVDRRKPRLIAAEVEGTPW